MEQENNELMITNDEQVNVMGFSNSRANSNVEVTTLSNIKDRKLLFNLQSHVDYKLNDCVGDAIRVKGVLIRFFKKPLKEPIFDEDTGEIIKDSQTNVSCILIDDNGKSYATGSMSFAMNLRSYLGDFDGEKELDEGIEMKIIKVDVPNSPNKALGFEIL